MIKSTPVNYTKMRKGTKTTKGETVQYCPKCGRKGSYKPAYKYRGKSYPARYIHKGAIVETFMPLFEIHEDCHVFEPDIANIFQVIAAVAADNLMHNKITETAGGYRLAIMDGMGNELSEPVVKFGKRQIVEHAGIWYCNYRYGEFNDAYPGSLGDGKGVGYRFSPMGVWDTQNKQSKGR